jgi:hypothetical protein
VVDSDVGFGPRPQPIDNWQLTHGLDIELVFPTSDSFELNACDAISLHRLYSLNASVSIDCAAHCSINFDIGKSHDRACAWLLPCKRAYLHEQSLMKQISDVGTWRLRPTLK